MDTRFQNLLSIIPTLRCCAVGSTVNSQYKLIHGLRSLLVLLPEHEVYVTIDFIAARPWEAVEVYGFWLVWEIDQLADWANELIGDQAASAAAA